MQDHLIVCGMGHVGFRVAELLHALEEPFTIIARDIDPAWRAAAAAYALRFVEGDARSEECLRKAGIMSARAMLIVTDDDLINTEIALDAGRLNPAVSLIVRVFDRHLADQVEKIPGVRKVLSPAMLTTPVFLGAALGRQTLRVFEFGGAHLHVVRVTFPFDPSEDVETLDAFCAHYDLAPIAVHRANHETQGKASMGIPAAESTTDTDGDAPIPADLRLRRSDEVVVVAASPAVDHLRRDGFVHVPLEASTRHRNRRSRASEALGQLVSVVRQAIRMWRRTPPILRIAFLALNSLVGLSVVVFHYLLPGHPSWVDSLYFVVTIMTTVGFGDYNLQHAGPWMKLYGCVVMIGGATLVAIVFGIITDFIVTTRVEQALGRHKSTLTNHIVVVGLGDVGTRVAEELHRIGEPVVAMERDEDQDSIQGLQDNMQVIVADAHRKNALLQANVEEARALFVTLTNDMDGLRVAHLARTIQPEIRTAVRIYDSSLARKLGGSLGVDYAVNAAETAAATFVGCALRTGVEQGFTLNRRLYLFRWREVKEIVAPGSAPATIAEIRAHGYHILLKQAAADQHAVPVTAYHQVAPTDRLLLLEAMIKDEG